MVVMTLTSGRYAAVTSTLALLVALGGTSYAAATIGTANIKDNAVISTKIKNGSVVGADVATNTLTGVDVDESKLGIVRNADTAQYASDAGTVGGLTVKRVDDVEDTVAGRPHLLVNQDGFEVELTCAVVSGTTEMGLVARTSRSGSTIATVSTNDQPTPVVQETDLENASFGPEDGDVDLLAGDDGNLAQVTFTYDDPNGAVVQGTLVTDIAPTTEPCSVRGFIIAG